MRGPHVGVGKLAVADRWLEIAGMVLGEVAAAAAPATTTDRAKIRIASFMMSNPSGVRLTRMMFPVTMKY